MSPVSSGGGLPGPPAREGQGGIAERMFLLLEWQTSHPTVSRQMRLHSICDIGLERQKSWLNLVPWRGLTAEKGATMDEHCFSSCFCM